jgi:hypothetical protein
MNQRLVDAILAYGARYRTTHLVERYKPAELLRDWWKAFDFFLGRACFQGRRDTLSERVYQAAIAALKPPVSQTDGIVPEAQLPLIERALAGRIGRGHVGKARDVQMVVSALRYIRNLPHANLVAYSVASIKAGGVREHFLELQHAKSPATGIRQVGPKVAAFYLRDVVSLFELEPAVPPDVQYCLQPVDVWVRRLAPRIGVVSEEAPDDAIVNALVQLCLERRCSPLQFNQGAWYAGYFAFDLLLEHLASVPD